MSEPQVTTRSIAGLQIGSSVVGEGPPVVALHGWGGSVQSFWPVAERLAPLPQQAARNRQPSRVRCRRHEHVGAQAHVGQEA